MNIENKKMDVQNENLNKKSDLDNGIIGQDLRLMSVSEARKLLNIGHHSVIKLILSGQLHAVKINTRYKIPLLSVKNYIESISKYEKINNEESIVPRYNTVSQHDVESVLDRMYKKYSTN